MDRAEKIDPLSGVSVEDLARQAQAGSSAAFDALVERLGPRLRGFLRRRAGSPSDVDDLCQETFLRAYRHLDRYEPERPFAGWLFAIAGNLAVSQARKRRPQPGPHPEAVAAEDDPAEVLARRERRTNVWQAAQDVLPGRQYQALWLRYALGRSVRETAQAMHLTRMHVRVLLHRARRRLLARPGLREEI